MPMLGVNGATKTNVFLSSINTSANERVNVDALCKDPGGRGGLLGEWVWAGIVVVLIKFPRV